MIRNWGMGDKKVVDLSRFLRFEATGDSELADLGGAAADDQWNNPSLLSDDEDDAESCVCDEGFHASFQSRGVDQDETPSDDDDGSIAHHHHHHRKSSAFEDEDEEEEEEEEGMVSEVASTANSYSSRKCNVHSTNKEMSEMEKNRLFWEACLAS